MQVVVPKEAAFKPVSFEKITQRLAEDEKGKQDIVLLGRDIEFTEHGTLRLHGGGTVTKPEYKVADWAFGQLCTKIGVPSSYLRKCPITGPSGQKAQIDHWKERIADKGIMLRVKNTPPGSLKVLDQPVNGAVRAVLSENYHALDNIPVWNNLRPFLDKNGFQVQMANLNDQSFHIRALTDESYKIKTKTDQDGTHKVGLHISNSETGALFLRGDMLVWRLVCSNGMMGWGKEPLFRQRHIKTEQNALRMQIASALSGIQHHKTEVMERLMESNLETIKTPKKTLELVMNNARLPKDVIEVALTMWDREPIATRFGLSQAMTAAAKTLNMDKRTELEGLAGRWLVRSAKSKQQLAEA